ncbi:MAG: outer membrane beta-barrel protein [Pseudomonadota bacterium]
MRFLYTAAACIFLTMTTAEAADQAYVSETFDKRWDWSGVQLGVQAGYGITHDRITVGPCAFGPDFDCRAGGDDDVYGAFININRHYGPLVVGAEISYAHHDSEFDDTSTVAIKDTTTFSLRAGYAIDRVLPYAFVGTVYGRTSSDALPAPFNLPAGWAGEDFGFAFGAGLDIGVTDKIFVGLRYERDFFSNFNNLGIDATIDSAVARLGYKY